MTAPALVGVPELETERLRLRAPSEADFEPFAAFYATERSRFVGGPLPRGKVWRSHAALVGHWALRGYGWWSLEERATGALAGRVGLFHPEGWPEPEIGWTLFDGFEGRGYATEA
ncbi:MAG TPA: GNAT family N-acetyltransferase, partial [Paracoccaceae bacterium]|nr:GNAT family N-acetyltransferase [Paracoccaceae bacterium]